MRIVLDTDVMVAVMRSATGASRQLLLAGVHGVSLNQFINVAVAEKTAALSGARMMAERAKRADRDAFDAVMARTGPETPREGDETTAR